jgi:uncharacterized membrane protein YfcA
MLFLVFLICFSASIVGAICGIGGGVIIKPVLDAFGIMSVSTISFLSGCTVLSMTTYSVLSGRKKGNSAFEKATGLPLAIGAAAGGILGKELFEIIKSLSTDPERVGAVQEGCLLIVTLGTLLYTLYKSRIPTRQVKHPLFCLFIGLILGLLSAFLGIGGGPINLVVLFYFFSMDSKAAAENSLYLIFFSQLASLLFTLITGKVPEFPMGLFVCMVCCGILGGAVGRKINKKIASQTVSKLFLGLMIVIMGICCYNFYRFI